MYCFQKKKKNMIDTYANNAIFFLSDERKSTFEAALNSVVVRVVKIYIVPFPVVFVIAMGHSGHYCSN